MSGAGGKLIYHAPIVFISPHCTILFPEVIIYLHSTGFLNPQHMPSTRSTILLYNRVALVSEDEDERCMSGSEAVSGHSRKRLSGSGGRGAKSGCHKKIGLSAERQIGRAHTPLTCSATRAAAAKNLRFSCHCLAVLWSPSVCLLFTIQYSLLSVLHGVNENVFNFY